MSDEKIIQASHDDLHMTQADLAWMLPNCLAGAACILGGMGFVVYFLRLLIAEAEGWPVKTA